MEKFDCAIIGAGPAGLNAALVLSRARKNIILFDNETNRNLVTKESHSFLTRDGIKPKTFKNIALEDILKYEQTQYEIQEVLSIIKKEENIFNIETADRSYQAKSVLIATGIKEIFPANLNIGEFYGKSLFSCPFCDGWELSDKNLVLISENEEHAIMKSKLIQNWTSNVFVASNGAEFSHQAKEIFEKSNIKYFSSPIEKLNGNDGLIENIKFNNGKVVNCSGGFIDVEFERKEKFGTQLNCEMLSTGEYILDASGRTSQENIYVAGETTSGEDSSLVLAASEGYKAAVAIVFDQMD